MKAAISVIAGLAVGLLIGRITEVYTSADYNFVKKIADQAETGPATAIISGLAVGMQSTAIPVILIYGIFGKDVVLAQDFVCGFWMKSCEKQSEKIDPIYCFTVQV